MNSPENLRSKPGSRPEKIKLNGHEFEFVVGQRGGQSAVYKSEDSFVRIGESGKIHADLALHKSMEDAGFPVAKVLAEGEQSGLAYFIESSLGDKHLGKVFAEDIKQNGVIGEVAYQQLLTVAERFARAQLTTRSEVKDYDEFSRGIWLERLCDELPEQALKLQTRFGAMREQTAGLPFVITHGDFNPNNLYEAGVIDLEDSFHAPYGYDLVSAISHINYFPDSKDYEFYAKYRFTPEQKQRYFERMDTISVEVGLPPLSQLEEDFEFCRAVWLAADLPHVPKLQRYRQDMVIERFLKE